MRIEERKNEKIRNENKPQSPYFNRGLNKIGKEDIFLHHIRFDKLKREQANEKSVQLLMLNLIPIISLQLKSRKRKKEIKMNINIYIYRERENKKFFNHNCSNY